MSKLFDVAGWPSDTPTLAPPASPPRAGKVATADRVAARPQPQAAARPLGEPLLSARGLVKSYRKEKLAIPVLRGVDFEVREREFTAVVGQSGSGKSTLLHLLATLDCPDEGEIHFAGNRIDNLPPVSRDLVRNRCLGMIFQFYHLLPELTMLENVLTPCMIAESVWSYWRRRKVLRQRATHLLEMVGLGHRLNHRPRELSGGEMQRTAIARALMADPEILLADEPTGNLDQKTGQDIMDILCRLNREGLTIVMVTHDAGVAAQAHRTVRLAGGRVEVADEVT
jgi:lipoprotein-releasing system ATP-binding protein